MPFYPYCGAANAHAFALFLTAYDPECLVDAAVWRRIRCERPVLLDVGAGNGHLAGRFAPRCRLVWALEPDHNMLLQLHAAMAAPGAPANVGVLPCDAEAVPLPDASVDVVHARFAYFFGTDACLPGLAEARRVLRHGGDMIVIEGSTHGDFGSIWREFFPSSFNADNQSAVLAFWRERGFTHEHITTVWRAPDRQTMADALALEHSPEAIRSIMDRHPGCEMSCGIHLFHWRKE